MLCGKCHKQEAVLHVTETWAGGSVSKEIGLCAECARLCEGLEGITNLDAAVNGAPCRYCGGEPSSGGGDPIAGLSGVRKMSFMCKTCAEEYNRVLEQQLPGFVDCATAATVTDDLIAKLRAADMSAVFTAIEDHMRNWVAERK